MPIAAKTNLFHFSLTEIFTVLPPAETFLQPNDLKRLANISAPARRREFLVSRYVLKCILQEVYRANRYQLRYSINGKPYLVGALKHLQINMSHSYESAVIAISSEGAVGVDLEVSPKKKNIKRIAQTHFHPLESAYIFSASKSNLRVLRFQKLWALKEAYIKAEGQKLNKKNIHIYFDILAKRQVQLPSKKTWSFRLHKDLPLAICSQGQGSFAYFELYLKRQKLVIKKRPNSLFFSLQ